MVRTKDEAGIKSSLIVMEVQKRPCLFDSNHPNYGDRAEKFRCWEEVCEHVVPGWSALETSHKFAAAKEVQKRWRSIRDSYTKSFRQGKCVPAEQCTPGSRRYLYHQQMAFLLRALQNKKPRYSQDKYESFSEVSNSPQHPPPDDIPKIKTEIMDKPLDLKTRPEVQKPEPQKPETEIEKEKGKPETQDKCNQITIDNEKSSFEIKIDANSILPDDHFDDDKLFMNSLIPLFKKMDDDTRLLCRIEVLKIIRYALQGHKSFEALKIAEDSFFKNRMSGILAKEENSEESSSSSKNESRLSMTTRSADGSRPIRKRRDRSPTPPQVQPKRRGPGRPRKVRPAAAGEPEPERASPPRRGRPPPPPPPPPRAPSPPHRPDTEDSYSRATSVAQLPPSLFMKMYNLSRSKDAPLLTSTPQTTPVQIKMEPTDPENNTS